MKIIRYQDSAGQTHHGVQHDTGATRLEGCPLGDHQDSGEAADLHKLLAPVQPADILCIGLNYRRHAEEGGSDIPEHPILSPEQALDHVLGYTCANDVSARDWQLNYGGSQWCRGKTFDTFCPLGPCLVTSDEIPDPNALQIRTLLNGNVMQDWNTEDMIFNVPQLIAFLSGSTTLPAGTVILTGTPHGIGSARIPPVFLADGDSVTIEIEKIGSLTNPVMNEAT
jgi:2-keto-4-pentenoate hydratase/2-oxohepta-3-ene-1,7-dioic acid hydratase in catechol pathway